MIKRKGDKSENEIAIDEKKSYFGTDDDSAEVRYQGFLDFLTDKYKLEPVWVVYDFPYKTANGQDNNKLILFAWCPDCANIKKKMVFASTKDALKKVLPGINKDFQACDV